MVGRTLDAVIPRIIVRMAVAILFAIRLVVLVVIGHEIVERKSVMGGDKIYARPRLAPASIEEIAGAGDTRGESASLPSSPFQYDRAVSR